MNQLYPKINPYDYGMMSVGKIHTIYWERSGNPSGIPVLVIHGGPGGGSQPLYRRYFNPDKFDIIQFDQRGCGKSKPLAELKENTTSNLILDIELLREKLGLNSWYIFGGSWGSTLGLIYAINHKKRVRGMILRGVFLCRSSELKWFYSYGASEIFPDEFQLLKDLTSVNDKEDIISYFYSRLISNDWNLISKYAKAWTRWEMATSCLLTEDDYLEKANDDNFAIAFARIECHYFVNNIFMQDNYILNNIESIKDILTIIIQGRYDIICPAKSAWELHNSLINSSLEIIQDAGHSISEEGITDALIRTTDNL